MADTLSKANNPKHKWLATALGVTLAQVGAAGQPPVARPGALKAPASTTGKLQAGPEAVPKPVAIPRTLSAVDMKDEEIATAIMDKQYAILDGWQTALGNFDKTMTSSADAEATPEFQKTVVGYFTDKLMGALIEHTPGASELDAIVKALDSEYKRAAAAGGSAKLRDFVIQHATAIGKLKQATLAQREGFIAAVRAQREAVDAIQVPQPSKSGAKGGKGGKGGVVFTSRQLDDYGMMRMALMDTLEAVGKTLSISTPEALFRVLSEEWIRHTTVRGGMGIRFKAVVVIRLNPNYSVKDAYIQGAGGQKLAEQLLKDSPDGVDVFRLQAPRVIKLMADNGWPSAMLSLDANNRDISTGSILEGNTDSLMKYVMSHGLPPTKNLTGD